MTTDPVRNAKLDQQYAALEETLIRLAPILGRYREQLHREGFTDEEAEALCVRMQDTLIIGHLQDDTRGI